MNILSLSLSKKLLLAFTPLSSPQKKFFSTTRQKIYSSSDEVKLVSLYGGSTRWAFFLPRWRFFFPRWPFSFRGGFFFFRDGLFHRVGLFRRLPDGYATVTRRFYSVSLRLTSFQTTDELYIF